MEDIAIVGIGLRFPGDASCPEELWKVLERGESQWTEFPRERLNIDGYYHPGGERQGSISFRGAHFLKGDVAAFDASFFSVSAEDAKAIDPQQRMLLETTYEALENAGIRKEDVDGSDAAVYVGSFVKDYEQVCLRDPDWQPQYAATGNGIAIMANRISYFFNLHGPSMTIDTGCSGSLVSVHLAAQSLLAGETSLAIAAGAGLILTPNTIMPMTALNFLSLDGKCFTFDARANGYGRGEGVGVVIMKRLSDALRDNDTIRAVIRATRVNQDGRTTGITLPSKEAQLANIFSVYESARLDFDQTAYVECHGTGTQAGDWRELKAISESLGSVRSIDNPIVVGSIKPNIGHLEGAAGVAGLIKGILVLEHGQIPPNINFENGNPDIHFKEWRVKVPLKTMDWPLPGLRRVSVNCFGFGGTNAHVILDEAPRYMSARGLNGNHNSVETESSIRESRPTTVVNTDFEPQIFCYSSNEKAGVQRIMKSHIPYLASIHATSSTDLIQNYAYTLGCRRSELEWRNVVVSTSCQNLVSTLQNCNDASFARASKGRKPKICFIFCGQGTQYPQMGKDLLMFEPFRRSFQAASAYMKTVLGSPFDLFDETFQPSETSRISNPEISQPATTAFQVALIDLFESFNMKPMYVLGHSSGEVAAAFAAGALSREAAWEVAYYRGLASSKIPLKDPSLKGAMISIGMSLERVERYLQLVKNEVQVACVNSPKSITVSGKASTIQQIADDLSKKKLFHRVLKVNVAYHSSHMRLVEEDYTAMLEHICPTEGSGPTMISTVTGGFVDGSDLNCHYWSRNMVSPVRYVDAVTSLMELPADEQPDVIIELSPSSALRSPTSDILSEVAPRNPPAYKSVIMGKGNSAVSLLNVVGYLWTQGYPVDMKEVISRGNKQAHLKCLADLPPYLWYHDKSYWHESHLGKANRFRKYGRQDLIGAPTADAISFEPRWRGFLRISENPWIQDHQVQKTVVYPAAGMVTMALEGASQLIDDKSQILGYEITNMRIDKAMVIPNTTHGLETAINFKRITNSATGKIEDAGFEFAIYSKHLDHPWEQHANGLLQIHSKHENANAMFQSLQNQYESLKKSCTEEVKPRQLYEHLDIVGMNYGPLFQNITELAKGGDSCICKVRIPDTKSKMPAKFEYPHLIHPATLDSMFQSPFALDTQPMVPMYIDSLFISASTSRDSEHGFTGFTTASRNGTSNANAQISMTQGNWDYPSVVIRGLHFTSLSVSSASIGGFLPNHRNLCTEIAWGEDYTFSTSLDLKKVIRMMAHKYGGLSILQLGGSLPLTRDILDACTSSIRQVPWLARYTITTSDYEESEVFSWVKGTIYESFVEKRAVDAPNPLPEYHLILISGHVDLDASKLFTHLDPTGLLISLEGDERLAGVDGAVPYRYELNGREIYTLVQRHRPPPPKILSHGIIILLPDNAHFAAIRLAANLRNRMVGFPSTPVMTMYADELLTNLGYIKASIVISLLDFSESFMAQPSVFTWSKDGFDVFHKLQSLAKGILWVTQGAHMNPQNPKAAPIIGLARTLISEDPLKNLVTLDLAIDTQLHGLETAQTIINVVNKKFANDSNSTPQETEYAEENGKIFIPRIVPIEPLNRWIENDWPSDTVMVPFQSSTNRLKLDIIQPGARSGDILFSTLNVTSPRNTEVEVIFDHACITPYDLDIAMGRSTESFIGLDVTGYIGSVGNDGSGLATNMRVSAIALDGAFQNRQTIDARFVKQWSFDLPLSHYVSSYYALEKIGRLGRGKSVLIHAGASSFGLAAIQMASHLGGEIFATVIGPSAPQQRSLIEEFGIASDHVLDASSNSLATSLKDLTGKGVDVIYNCTQQHVEANLNGLRAGGMIIQFASKSPCPRVVRMTNSSTSFVSFDLVQLLRDDPDYVADLLDETVHFLKGAKINLGIPSWLIQSVELSQLDIGLHKLEKDPYLGLISITAGTSSETLVKVKAPTITKPLHEALSPNGTYVLAGGLGGLGKSICELLVDNGVKHIAFLSRSGASSAASINFLEALKEKGVDARVYQADICNSRGGKNSLIEAHAHIKAEMPPVLGVFQSAAVIKDAVFENMTYEDWMTAFNPKAAGSTNLVQVFLEAGANPFFIFLASSAGVIGNRGQANYAAGNCYMDALARSLRLQGKHAVSIDLGPVLGAGMLADDEEVLDMLRASGFYGIRHQDFLTMIKHAITMEMAPLVPMPPQVIMGIGTGGLIRQNQPADPYWTRTALYNYMNLVDLPPDLSITKGPNNVDMKSMLSSCVDAASASEIICTGLSHMLAKALNLLPEEIDSSKPPNVYGVDSLVAVGVRNWVISNCGVEVSVFEVLSDASIEELANAIAEKGRFGAEKN